MGHLEDQHHLTRKELTKQAETRGYGAPYLARASSLVNPDDGSRKSYGENLDGLCENIELAIRFILHGKAKLTQPDRSQVSSPYNDPDYQAYLTLAGIWPVVGSAWANLRYRQWDWLLNRDKQNVCARRDPAEMLREHVAAIRYNIFVEQRVLRSVAERRDAGDQAKTRQVVDSLTLSTENPVWDGGIDVPGLKSLCERSDFSVFCDEYVSARHYSPLLPKLTVAGIDWKTWYGGSNVLRVLADVVMTRLEEIVDEDDKAGPLKRVPVVLAKVLRDLIVACSGLGEDEAEQFLNAVRFDPKRKNLEDLGISLIPCSADGYFFVPCLVNSGNPARAIENFVDEWAATFDSRGVPFEEYLIHELRDRQTALSPMASRFRSQNASSKFDILFYWKGYLFLIEAKCSKSILSAADYFVLSSSFPKKLHYK